MINTGRLSLTAEQDSSFATYRDNDDQVIALNRNQTGHVASTSSEGHVTSSEGHLMSSQNRTITLGSQVHVNATTPTVHSGSFTVQSRIKRRSHSVLSVRMKETTLPHPTSNSISVIMLNEVRPLSSSSHSGSIPSSMTDVSTYYATPSKVSFTHSPGSVRSSATIADFPTMDTTTETPPTATPTMRPGLYILMVFLSPVIFGTLFILLCPILCCMCGCRCAGTGVRTRRYHGYKYEQVELH